MNTHSTLPFMICALLSILLAASVQAQEKEEESKERPLWQVTVPLVVNVRGIGDVEWRTELFLRNDTGSEIDVALSLTGVAGQPFFFTTLAPGQSIVFSDPVRETFGLERAMSPMIVTTAGTRSVSISSSVVGYVEGRVLRPQPFVPIYAPAYAGLRSLGGLEISERFRTNLGLVNYGEEPAIFSLAVQRLPGRNLATTTLTVSEHSVVQLPLQTWFPLVGDGAGLTVVVDTSSPNTYCYASVLENATQQPRLVTPTSIPFRTSFE